MSGLGNSFNLDDHYCEVELDYLPQLASIDFMSSYEMPAGNIEQLNESSNKQLLVLYSIDNNNSIIPQTRQNEIYVSEQQLNFVQQQGIKEDPFKQQIHEEFDLKKDKKRNVSLFIGQMIRILAQQMRISVIRLPAQFVKIVGSNIPIIIYFFILILFLASSFAIPSKKHLPTDFLLDWLAFYKDSVLVLYSGTLSYCGSLSLLLILFWRKFGDEKIAKKEVIDMFLRQNPILQYLVLALLNSDLIPNQFDLSIWICHGFTFFAFRTTLTHLEIRLQMMTESLNVDSTNQSSALDKIRNLKIISKCIVLATMWICGISAHLFYKTGVMRLILLLFEGFLILIESYKNQFRQKVFSFEPKDTNEVNAQYSADISSDANNESMYEPNFVFEVAFDFMVHFMRLIHGYYSTRLNQDFKITLSQLLKQLLIIVSNDSIHNSFSGMRSNFIMLAKVLWFKSNLDRIFPLVQSIKESENQIAVYEVCSICHDDLRVSRKIASCGHKYHIRCLFNWIKSQVTPQCPLCRADIHGLYFSQSGFQLVLGLLKSQFQLIQETITRYVNEKRVRKTIPDETNNGKSNNKWKIIEGELMNSNRSIEYEVQVNDLRKEVFDKKGVIEEDIDEFI